MTTCPHAAEGLRDASAGRRKYADYLAWLSEDEPGQKELRFDRMSKGWAMGSKPFKTALLGDEKSMKAGLEPGVCRRRGNARGKEDKGEEAVGTVGRKK
jgi:hypothetical protein